MNGDVSGEDACVATLTAPRRWSESFALPLPKFGWLPPHMEFYLFPMLEKQVLELQRQLFSVCHKHECNTILTESRLHCQTTSLLQLTARAQSNIVCIIILNSNISTTTIIGWPMVLLKVLVNAWKGKEDPRETVCIKCTVPQWKKVGYKCNKINALIWCTWRFTYCTKIPVERGNVGGLAAPSAHLNNWSWWLLPIFFGGGGGGGTYHYNS